MVIDTHPHVISTDTGRYPNAPVGGHKSDWSRERPVSVEQMIAAMDQAGIAKSALVQASTCYGHDNSLIADAVAAHPNRFTGVFSVDVLAPDAPEKIRYWVGRNLINYNAERYAREADLRYTLVRVNEHIDSISLAGGEADEARRLKLDLAAVLKAMRRLVTGLTKLGFEGELSYADCSARLLPADLVARDASRRRLSFGLGCFFGSRAAASPGTFVLLQRIGKAPALGRFHRT